MKNAFITVVTQQGLGELKMLENIFAKHLKPFEGEKVSGILKVRRYVKPERWEIVDPKRSDSPGHILPGIIINPTFMSYYTINPEEYFNSFEYQECKSVVSRMRSALRSTVTELISTGLGDIVQYSEGFGNSFYNRHMLLDIRHAMTVEGVRAGIFWDANFGSLGNELSFEELTKKIEQMVLKTQEEQLSRLPDIAVTYFKDRNEMNLPAEVRSLIDQIDERKGSLVECSDVAEKLEQMGIDFVPIFIELLKDRKEYVRFYMVTILRDLRDKRAVDDIRFLSENDPSNLVRLSAKVALEKLDTV